VKFFQSKRTRHLSCDGRLFDQRTVTILMQSCHKHAFYDTSDSDLSCIVPLTVEQNDNYVKQLKYSKATRSDGLTAEHLKYTHPALAVHLKLLMCLMLSYGYVPEAFWSYCAASKR